MTDSWWGFVKGQRQVGMLMRVTHVQRDLPLIHTLSFSLSQPNSHIPTDAPAEQAVEKRRLFAHTVPVPAAPGEYSTPPALLSPSANKPHARTLFELSPTVATHLSVSSGSCCLSFLNTHRWILYLILIYGLAELLLKFPGPHSPGLISRPYQKKKKSLFVPLEKGTRAHYTWTKTNQCKICENHMWLW